MDSPYLQEKSLYFLHIPKTAGTTLISYLHSQFEPDAICPAYLWSELLRISADTLTQYRLFRGHFYHYINTLVQQDLTYITFLRDPIERSISHYQHILRDPYHYLHKKVSAMPTLAAFLSDPETIPMISNFQTRAIAYDLNPISIAAILSQAELDSLTLEQMLECAMPADISDQVLLQRAKDRLDQFAFVGIVEQFESSIAVLAHRFGWNNPNNTPFLNVSQRRITKLDMPSRTMQLLNEHILLDQELYRYGKELFEKQCSRLSTHMYIVPGQYHSYGGSTTEEPAATQPSRSAIVDTYKRPPYLRRLAAGLCYLRDALWSDRH